MNVRSGSALRSELHVHKGRNDPDIRARYCIVNRKIKSLITFALCVVRTAFSALTTFRCFSSNDQAVPGSDLNYVLKHLDEELRKLGRTHF